MNEYDEQAKKFLEKTNTTLRVYSQIARKKPLWLENENDDFGNYYICELKNSKGSYIFDYWGSINDSNSMALRHPLPSKYNVLACLERYEPSQNHYDFCNDFGYTPSQRTEKIFNSVIEQWKELNKLFTPKELEKLADIQ